MKNEGIHFGTIRKYCSRIDRVSICMQETLCYKNFEHIELVPAEYDDLYLYGFGMIESKFLEEHVLWGRKCIEFMLSKEPRTNIVS